MLILMKSDKTSKDWKYHWEEVYTINPKEVISETISWTVDNLEFLSL